MENNNNLNERFIEALLQRHPDKSDIVDTITTVSNINKVSAYRKLRGEAKFSVDEIGFLASYFNISLDELIGELPKDPYESILIDLPFSQAPNEIEPELMGWHIDNLHSLSYSQMSETGSANTTLPRFLYLGYRQILKFLDFKWKFFSQPKPNMHFSDIELSDGVWEHCMNAYMDFRKINHTFVIWDKRIIPDMVKDIKYYRSLGLISETDVRLLGHEMNLMIDLLESYAVVGRFETGNSFELYKSSVNIDTSHSFFHSEDTWTYTMVAYNSRLMITKDAKTAMMMKKWITAQKADSVLISSSAAGERKAFFDLQRRAISAI